ncbi:hypothetical protein DAT35_16050 [Vitiosangium sp. GDMCC 1.1324]|nr:hypothetical protein DAT35_16050 [Vitiosangium sp. GDMCC 1.1324]
MPTSRAFMRESRRGPARTAMSRFSASRSTTREVNSRSTSTFGCSSRKPAITSPMMPRPMFTLAVMRSVPRGARWARVSVVSAVSSAASAWVQAA